VPKEPKKKKAKPTREAGGEKWHDETLDDWDKSVLHLPAYRTIELPNCLPSCLLHFLWLPRCCRHVTLWRAVNTDDFRIFVGDLGIEVSDEGLSRAFMKYPSFLRAKVVKDNRSGKSKGYGFVSLKEGTDFIKAMREMNGVYWPARPPARLCPVNRPHRMGGAGAHAQGSTSATDLSSCAAALGRTASSKSRRARVARAKRVAGSSIASRAGRL